VPKIRTFAPIWRDIARVLEVKPEHLELWDRDPENKPIWLRGTDWKESFSAWCAKPDNEKRFIPNPKLKSTNGWSRKKYNSGKCKYPIFDDDEAHHRFEFKLNECDLTKEEIYRYANSVTTWAMTMMPYNCGMACLTDLHVSDRYSRMGIGTLITEFAERQVLYSNFHAVCATCIYDEDEPDGMVKIFERRDWTRVSEFYNKNSENMVALYFKELES
jgi:hypothetical protein